MLDIKFIRDNTDKVKEGIRLKGSDADIDDILRLDKQKRELLTAVERLKEERNKASSRIGAMVQKKEDVSDLKASMRKVSDQIKDLDHKIADLDKDLGEKMLWVPNIPYSETPRGKDPSDNVVLRSWGSPKRFDFKPLSHWELGTDLGLIDFDRASKMSGSGFVVFTGIGARLERALVQFMLDMHTKKHGYTEIAPPLIVNKRTMTGTGQLPKLKEDMYCIEQDDMYLIPTGEVPATSYFQDELIDEWRLPVYLCAYTACFRREAGSYGKETRGMTRIHQFDKVELLKFVKPEDSYDELESLLENAQEVLRALELPYRIIKLCTGDLSFASTMCYDIEVWAAGQEKFLEVSSCSNFEDFQARRLGIRYKDSKTKKNRFLHTLNASGVALPRTFVAVLENYQQSDGSVVMPVALRPYMDGMEVIKKPLTVNPKILGP